MNFMRFRIVNIVDCIDSTVHEDVRNIIELAHKLVLK